MKDKNIGYERLRAEYVPSDWMFCEDAVVNILHGLPEEDRKALICVVEKGVRAGARDCNTSKSDMGRKFLKLKNKIRQNLTKS